MDTMQIDILNPKAIKLLENLADLNLISIRNSSNDTLLDVINRFRAKADENVPSIDEIVAEVKQVRKAHHAKTK